MSDYEIRKGVPAPPVSKAKGLSATLRKMAVGDSIVIPAAQHLGVHTCARAVGAKVRTRSNGDGTVTVWCVVPSPAVPTSPSDGSVKRSAGALPENMDPIWETFLTADGEFPSGEYRQDHPLGPNIWYADRDENGQPVNKHKKAASVPTPPPAGPPTASEDRDFFS